MIPGKKFKFTVRLNGKIYAAVNDPLLALSAAQRLQLAVPTSTVEIWDGEARVYPEKKPVTRAQGRSGECEAAG